MKILTQNNFFSLIGIWSLFLKVRNNEKEKITPNTFTLRKIFGMIWNFSKIVLIYIDILKDDTLDFH